MKAEHREHVPDSNDHLIYQNIQPTTVSSQPSTSQRTATSDSAQMDLEQTFPPATVAPKPQDLPGALPIHSKVLGFNPDKFYSRLTISYIFS